MTIDEFRKDHCYYYIATIAEPIPENVHDGDTFTAVLDLGTDQRNHRFKVRPIGYNAPEIVGASRKEGLEAKAYLIALFEEARAANGVARVALQTLKNKADQERMTGARYLAQVWIERPGGDLVELDRMMKAAGYHV